jgi:hypothetical protein
MSYYISENSRQRADNIAELYKQLQLAIQAARIAGVNDLQIRAVIERVHYSDEDPRYKIDKNLPTYRVACVAWRLRAEPLENLLGLLED